MENHELVAAPVALRIHAMPKTIAARIANMFCSFPFRGVITGPGAVCDTAH